ncbi:MAG: nucleotidyltransferase family protein [Chloroflexi bacterium]|nr:nucleotidyltransferase family protein [Chloroflexota bacterium]
MKKTSIDLPKDKIVDFCKRNHIRKLSLFGSVLRDDFKPGSDIDVLVEFEPGQVPGLNFFTMEIELSRLLRQKVDLNTPQFLSSHFREQVLAESEALYVAP